MGSSRLAGGVALSLVACLGAVVLATASADALVAWFARGGASFAAMVSVAVVGLVCSVGGRVAAKLLPRPTALAVTPTLGELHPPTGALATDLESLVKNAVLLLRRGGPTLLGATSVVGALLAAAELAVLRWAPGSTTAPYVPFFAAACWVNVASLATFSRSLERRPGLLEVLVGPFRSPSHAANMAQAALLPLVQCWPVFNPKGLTSLLPVVFFVAMYTHFHVYRQLGTILALTDAEPDESARAARVAAALAPVHPRLLSAGSFVVVLGWVSALLPRLGIIPSPGFLGAAIPIAPFLTIILVATAWYVGLLGAALLATARAGRSLAPDGSAMLAA